MMFVSGNNLVDNGLSCVCLPFPFRHLAQLHGADTQKSRHSPMPVKNLANCLLLKVTVVVLTSNKRRLCTTRTASYKNMPAMSATNALLVPLRFTAHSFLLLSIASIFDSCKTWWLALSHNAWPKRGKAYFLQERATPQACHQRRHGLKEIFSSLAKLHTIRLPCLLNLTRNEFNS